MSSGNRKCWEYFSAKNSLVTQSYKGVAREKAGSKQLNQLNIQLLITLVLEMNGLV